MEQVFVGFGSNQGDSVRICSQAVELLNRHRQITVCKISSFYRTEPVGMTEQDWFVNGVVRCETDLDPEVLLDVLQEIEKDFKRVRDQRWGPRTLDLDILFFGDRQLQLPGLTIPHPRLHERRFVLLPLVEIAPDWVHAGLGASVSDLLSRLPAAGQEVVRLDAA